MPKKKIASNFEQDLQELENIVQKLESGELNLEQSLAQFERGVTLTRACQKALSEAEQKIQKLTEKNGTQELQPFTAQQDD